MTEVVFLVDELDEATIESPGEGYVSIQPMTIHREARTAIFEHPNSRITFNSLKLGSKPRLSFGCALKQTCWDRISNGVVFKISLCDGSAKPIPLFEKVVDPKSSPSDRRWHDHEIDLSAYSGKLVTLTLETFVGNRDQLAYCWSGWSNPKILHELPTRSTRVRSDSHPHIFLITADALRADHLGCYGHPEMKTPHIDRMAQQGCLMSHARAQSPSTLASYASILTGRHVLEHGITSEWGRIPPNLLTLPVYLQSHGFHTALFASEAELLDPRVGATDLFAEKNTFVANPYQDGEITVRHFQRHLEHRPDQPCLYWLQFFDTHPPSIPPAPFNTMYYEGDPSDPDLSYRPELVPKVRGVESAANLEKGLKGLSRGLIDVCLVGRLRSTASAMRGSGLGPDLARHLKALGPSVCNGSDPDDFADWLDRQIDRLLSGEVPTELTAWITHIVAVLKRDVELEIVSWLTDVVDFRYPVSQYMGAVSYFDHLVGQVLQTLDDHGILQQSTIILTSPHGEVLNEKGIRFHHHHLLESVLRVPLIIKPAEKSLAGITIDGICDSIDLFPTIVDMLGCAVPTALPGVSRWPNVRDRSPIEDHDSIAVLNHGAMLSLTNGSHKFLKTLGTNYGSEYWQWRKGDRAVFDVFGTNIDSENRHDQETQLAREMEERLDAWANREDFQWDIAPHKMM